MAVGVAAGSSMAATTMLCQLLKSGDHVMAMNDLYGGEFKICLSNPACPVMLVMGKFN